MEGWSISTKLTTFLYDLIYSLFLFYYLFYYLTECTGGHVVQLAGRQANNFLGLRNPPNPSYFKVNMSLRSCLVWAYQRSLPKVLRNLLYASGKNSSPGFSSTKLLLPNSVWHGEKQFSFLPRQNALGNESFQLGDRIGNRKDNRE